MKEAGRNDIPIQPNDEGPKVEPSVLAPFPPPASDMVPEPPKGEWEPVPTTPVDRPRHIKGQNVKRTGEKRTGIVIKNSHRLTTPLKGKPKKARTKKNPRKR